MNKTLSTLTAATAGVGLIVASTSAKAFVIAPALAVAILAGGVLGGALLGSAMTNGYTYQIADAPSAGAVATAPSVSVNSTTCYFTHRWINHARTRVRVCDTPVAEAPVAAAAPAAAPTVAYGYPSVVTPAPVAATPVAAPTVEYPAIVAPEPVVAAPAVAPVGECQIIAGNRVCF